MPSNVVKVDFSDPAELLRERAVFDAIRKSRHPACDAAIVHIVRTVTARRLLCSKAESDAIIRRAIKAARRGIARRRRVFASESKNFADP